MTPVKKSVPIDEVVDFDDQLAIFKRMMADPDEKQLLFIRSPSESGKTTLLRLMRHHCGEVPTCRVDFRGEAFDNPHFTLAQEIWDQLGFPPRHMAKALQPLSGLSAASMAAETGIGGDVTDSVIVTQVLVQISPNDEALRQRYMQDRLKRAFLQDAQACVEKSGRVVFFFDHLEDISHEEEAWLIDALLEPVSDGRASGVTVVTGGHRWPNVEPGDWSPCAHMVPRLPPLTVEDFKDFGARIGQPLSDEEAELIWLGCECGNPMRMGMFIKSLRAAAAGGGE